MNSATDVRALGSADNPLQVAIIGSGPSGFYAAEALLKSPLSVRVDVFERLPVPYGLVRHGVAPDHPKLKQVSAVFDRIAQLPGFNFLGNVMVGRDVSVGDLRSTHHAVVVACGAGSDRRLGIPNEDLPGSHTATEFVGWYNGHPDFCDRYFDLSGGRVAIIGQGNVALDIARILAKPIDELRKTDIARHALDALVSSRVRDIHIIGRRGPAQTNFTHKELRELGDLPDTQCRVDPADMILGATCLTELDKKSSYNAAANVELLRTWSTPAAVAAKTIHFHFHRSPIALTGTKRVEGIALEINCLGGEPFGQEARGTGKLLALPIDLVFRSIGYRSLPIAGLPFDSSRAMIPNTAGRIGHAPGLYAVGWIKRGPSGIIGTNRADAVETVQSIFADLSLMDATPKPGANGVLAALAGNATEVFSYADWIRIDAEEIRAGALENRPRKKFTRVGDMRAVRAGNMQER